MTIHQYLTERARTEPEYETGDLAMLTDLISTPLLHYALGLATEACELAAASKASNTVNIIEELGDICWFAAGACVSLGQVPDETGVAAAPKTGVYEVIGLCEEFASRVKAALFYGSPIKKHDKREDYWTTIPAQILEIGRAHV